MLTLVIGDKNLSSWSLRAWLMLRHAGLQFEEIRLKLDTAQFQQQIRQYSEALRVPVLLDGELRVWESIAIAEYINEQIGGRGWPADPAARAHARSISAEMHAGFVALRTTWTMHALGKNPNVPLTPAARDDVARIDAIWSECRARYAPLGPWLFGEFSFADAMYAPVALRFNHYGAELSPPANSYFQQLMQDPHLQRWIREAAAEEGVIAS